ncbi:MAG: hypothetical protein FJX62_19930 [Alphaproteobacteria bacterium]|nr:hypothetical protein [Alphaproteobacteria bacterium]
MATPGDRDVRRRRLILRATTRREVELGLPISLEIAAALHSELAALFVEEEASLAASALPFPAMVGFSGGAVALDPARFEAAIRREAELCRTMLARAAERAKLAWSFEARRGVAAQLLCEACSVDDILVIGLDRLAASAADAMALARQLAPRQGGVLFVPERPVRRQGPVIVLAQPEAPETDVLAQFAATLAEALGSRMARIADIPASLTADLESARLLLAPLDGSPLDDAAVLRRVTAELRTPLLLLRTGRPE